MWNITRKNVAANKVRLALTALAIVLGVGFISAANILSDGLQDSFGSLAAEIVDGTDIEIRPDADVPITDEQIATVEAIDGVRVAEGEIGAWDNTVLPIRDDGSVLTKNGPPVLAFGWTVDNQLNPSAIEQGRAPEGPGEWVVDMTTAADEGFVIGETYEIIVPTTDGRTSAELVGTFRFGEDNTLNGATLLAFDKDVALTLFQENEFDAIVVASDGTRDVVDIRTDIEAALGDDYETLDTADLNAEQRADFNAFVGIFAWVLRSFAIIALFVSIFIIANTFNIVMSQRVRELGLLRAVGATPKQVRRAVLAEALVVGAIASAIGLVVGLGLAFGMEAALNAIGASLPDFDKPLSLSTALIGFGVGIGVTMLSAWAPARRAGRTSPITAIAGHAETGDAGRRSIIFGAVLTLLGAIATGVALFGGIDSTALLLTLLGLGAAVIFIGITLLSPTVAGPISRTLARPVALIHKTPGRLAGENAARNPKRTATTAAALMIGLSLVSMAFVVGQTLKSDLNELLESTVRADYAAFASTESGSVPQATLTALQESDELSNVTGLRYWGTFAESNDPLLEDPEVWFEVGNMPADRIDVLFDLDLTSGTWTDIDDNAIAMRQSVADELGVSLGDTIEIGTDNDEMATVEIVAVFEDGSIFSGIIVNDAVYEAISDQVNPDWIAANVAEGFTTEQADAVIDQIEVDFPQVIMQSAADYREEISGQVDFLLQLLSGFLGLAILIAFIGIVNTMALSIFERTRELGLLRAVGMTRSQMQRMVRWEAAIVSMVGALLGAVVGVIFGVLVVVATPAEILDNLTVPWLSLAVLVGVAAIAGLIAGFLPARRAGRLNVLDAISQ